MKQPKLLGLRTQVQVVPDLDEAKKWYEKALGVAPYFDEPFYVGFNVAGYEFGLSPEEDWPVGTERSANVYTYWGVEDAKATFDYWVSLGATPLEEPHNVGGPLVVAAVRDPWGNAFGCIYNPTFKAE